MKHFALFYDVVGGFVTKRGTYREEHLRLVHGAHDRGELVMAGALGDPPDGALLVFRAPDASTVEAFAKNDPYVINGLVTGWHVRQWNVVTSDSADRRQM
jgi:uncharacterized protein YciI